MSTKDEMVKCVKISDLGLAEGSLSLEEVSNPTRRSGTTHSLGAQIRKRNLPKVG
jgi:hypothetical protein